MNRDEFEKQFKLKYDATERTTDSLLQMIKDSPASAVIVIVILLLAAYGAFKALW